MKYIILILIIGFIEAVNAQTYTSYRTGNAGNLSTTALGGICLMGGASEQDEAMIWFLERSGGGDILILRTSGADGYNDYLYANLGVTVNSVETIVCHSSAASNESYVQDRIKEAEAIWFAGGDQSTYISYWRNTPVDSLINKGINERNIVVGGTSAGMAIQGGFYFTAENGTITSPNALSDPFNSSLTVSNDPFIQNNYLEQVITDTHYDNPDRKGRHVTFLARILNDYQIAAKGIACDEYTAVCITPQGIAHVYGDPAYDDIAYFIQPNCEVINNTPEVISISTPLTWNHGSSAIKTYVVFGTLDGSHTFDLNDWKTGNGGNWENWSVQNGSLTTLASFEPNCSLNTNEIKENGNFWPNPASEVINFNPSSGKKQLITPLGSVIISTKEPTILINDIPAGWYILEWMENTEIKRAALQIIH